MVTNHSVDAVETQVSANVKPEPMDHPPIKLLIVKGLVVQDYLSIIKVEGSAPKPSTIY